MQSGASGDDGAIGRGTRQDPPAAPSTRLALPPRLCVDTVAGARSALLADLDGTGPVEILGEDVVELDGSGLQLLLSLKASLDGTQRACALRTSPVLENALRLFDLRQHFEPAGAEAPR